MARAKISIRVFANRCPKTMWCHEQLYDWNFVCRVRHWARSRFAFQRAWLVAIGRRFWYDDRSIVASIYARHGSVRVGKNYATQKCCWRRREFFDHRYRYEEEKENKKNKRQAENSQQVRVWRLFRTFWSTCSTRGTCTWSFTCTGTRSWNLEYR